MTDFPSHLVDAYRRRYPSAWILGFLGYNPQHLLTDQRSELAKFAALHRPLGETYQPILTDPPYHHGGVFIPARRMGKTEAMQAALPAGEHVIPISRLHRYGMGTKKLADAFSSVGYSAQIAIEAQDRFTASMKRVQEQMARWQEKVMLRMLLAVENPEYPSPMFRREMRIELQLTRIMESSLRRHRAVRSGRRHDVRALALHEPRCAHLAAAPPIAMRCVHFICESNLQVSR